MTSRGNIDDQTDIRLSEYAVGTLPFEERVALEASLRQDDNLQKRLDWWQAQLVTLSEDVGPIAPPAGTLAAIEARLFATTAARRSWWDSVRFWRGLSIATAAALLVVTGLLALNTQTTTLQPQQRLVAQLSGSDSVLRVTAAFDPATQSVRINRTAGAADPNRSLELWVIAGDNAPVSLGLLPDQATGAIEVDDVIAERIMSNAILAISDEPSGGSPTGQPTGAVLVTGSVTEI